MSADFLTAYVLVWPLIAAGVFVTLMVALVKDLVKAKKEGKSLV